MNYQHRFHAGNFADVFKHVLLTRVLLYLTQKAAPLRYIDTHAGAGLYDLGEAAAQRTGEWRGGIGRLIRAATTPECGALLAPYLALLGAPRLDGSLAAYPGSPALAQSLLRAGDRMTLCEVQPQVLPELRASLGRDRRVKCLELDGYVGLKAFIPPRERRGLALIDPPFEEADEFERLAQALIGARAKWPGGVYLAWYPLKALRAADRLAAQIAATQPGSSLRIELLVASPDADGRRLAGCGMIVLNPPYTLAAQCMVILPELCRILGQDNEGQWRILDLD